LLLCGARLEGHDVQCGKSGLSALVAKRNLIDLTMEPTMKLIAMCSTAAVLILFPIGTVTAQSRSLTGPSISQPAGYGSYAFSGSKEPRVCLTRNSNGVRECRTRDEWAKIAHKLNKQQHGG
jgi:hypothetical protein